MEEPTKQRKHPLPKPSRSFIARRGTAVLLLAGAAALLQLAAGIGMSYWAGFANMDRAVNAFRPYWLGAMLGGLLISFVGYYFVYQEIFRVKNGPNLSRTEMIAVVGTGFSGFFAHGGAALDQYALKAAGASEREASVRVTSLGGLEHGVLGIGGFGAAVVVLLLGLSKPPGDFTYPWAIIPIPGFLLAFWLADKYRDRFRDAADGWRHKLAIFIDAVLLIKALFRHPLQHAPALLGMGLFWAADIFAAWSALAMFGFHMNGAQFIVAMATGMIFSRRTGPLGGAGVLTVVLALVAMYSGAPFAVAVAGIFAYRVFALWIPLPFSLLALPTLRSLGEEGPGQQGAPSSGEPALERKSA